MSNRNDQDYKFIILNFINNPIGANTNSPSGSSCQLFATIRSWVFSKGLNCGDDSGLILPVNFR